MKKRADFYYVDFALTDFSLICIYRDQTIFEIDHSPKKFKHKKISKKLMTYIINNKSEIDVYNTDSLSHFTYFKYKRISPTFLGILKKRYNLDEEIMRCKFIGSIKYD